MARLIELIATATGEHYLLVGLDNNSLSSFSWQLWITHYGTRMIDWCQAMSLNFITFMNSDLWVHNDEDTDRCNLFGEQRDCVVGVVSNKDPLKIKIYDSLGIHTDHEWEVQEIVIPATLNYPHGMYSKIPKKRFKKRDGVWRAEFLRNMKTTSGTVSVINALSGEPLRGEAIYMKLRNTDTDQVKLFKVAVNATISRV